MISYGLCRVLSFVCVLLSLLVLRVVVGFDCLKSRSLLFCLLGKWIELRLPEEDALTLLNG